MSDEKKPIEAMVIGWDVDEELEVAQAENQLLKEELSTYKAWKTRIEESGDEDGWAADLEKSLKIKEQDDLITKLYKQTAADDDFMAFMRGELEKWPCCHNEAGIGAHASTPPMMWAPELIGCICLRYHRDQLNMHRTQL